MKAGPKASTTLSAMPRVFRISATEFNSLSRDWGTATTGSWLIVAVGSIVAFSLPSRTSSFPSE